MLFVVPTHFQAFRLPLFVTFAKVLRLLWIFLLLGEIRYEVRQLWYELQLVNII